MINLLKNQLKHRKSVSDNVTYPKFCLDASNNDDIFNNFRNNDIYKNILEHVEFQVALKYFDLIKDKYRLSEVEIFDKVKILNTVGKPELIKISKDLPKLSTTGLRYLYTGLEIKEFIDSNNLNSNNIIELGCGYGGQSLILNELLDIKHYTYVDLDEVNFLIKRFLKNFSFNFNKSHSSLDSKFKNNYDFFISNYSFSELPRNLQNKALKKIINKSNAGYMIVNSDNFSEKYKFFKIEEYKKLFDEYEIIEENPQTSKKNVNFVYKFINI